MLEILVKNAELAKIAERIRWGVAGEADVMAIKPQDFLAIRTDDGEMHVRTSIEAVERAKDEPDDSRVRSFIASDETPDRYGDVIRVAGWDFTNFKKNPVALWAHNDHDFPVGKVVAMTKGERKGKPALFESIDYFGADVNPVSETVLRLIDAGGLRAVSVGFIPHKTNIPKTEEDRAALGLGRWGVEFLKVEQIELSNVPIPANPNCLVSKALVPMVRDMESSGQLSAAMARAFYAAAEKLEASERRVFALGGLEGSGQPAEARGAAPAAPSPVALRALETKLTVSNEVVEGSQPSAHGIDEDDDAEADADDAAAAAMLRAPARKPVIGEDVVGGFADAVEAPSFGGPEAIVPLEQPISVGARSAATPDVETRLLALEARCSLLQEELTQTRANLAQSVGALSGLLGLIETKEPSATAATTSGQGATKTAGARDGKDEDNYLALVFAESFDRALNR